jgi:hypothetical protein
MHLDGRVGLVPSERLDQQLGFYTGARAVFQ